MKSEKDVVLIPANAHSFSITHSLLHVPVGIP